jgi:hypothetical protein
MKTIIAIILTLLVAGRSLVRGAPQAAAHEWTFRAATLEPGRSADWLSARGLEAQLRFWNRAELGWALAGGLETWDARSEFALAGDPGATVSSLVQGEADLVLLGFSALYRVPLGPGADLVFEGGLRYVFADSQLTSLIAIEDSTGAYEFTERVHIEDSLLALLGVSFRAQLNDAVAVYAGADYRFDVAEPSQSFLGEALPDTSFEALGLHVGIGFAF